MCAWDLGRNSPVLPFRARGAVGGWEEVEEVEDDTIASGRCWADDAEADAFFLPMCLFLCVVPLRNVFLNEGQGNVCVDGSRIFTLGTRENRRPSAQNHGLMWPRADVDTLKPEVQGKQYVLVLSYWHG